MRMNGSTTGKATRASSSHTARYGGAPTRARVRGAARRERPLGPAARPRCFLSRRSFLSRGDRARPVGRMSGRFPGSSVTASKDGRESSRWPGSCRLEMGAVRKSAKNSPFPSSSPGVGDVTGESEPEKACFSLCHRLWLCEEFEHSLQCWAGLPTLISVFGFATELV